MDTTTAFLASRRCQELTRCACANAFMVSLRVASLFSGIGGLDLGLREAGHTHVLLCEHDAHCKQVLTARFPGVPLVNDVSEVLPFMIEDADLLVAGFPCNDCSCENQQRPGLEHGVATRSVAHVFRLLESKRTPWVLLENVTGLLKYHNVENKEQRPAIDYIVTELERLNYRWAHRVVDLLSFGTPHRRRRVFIVASQHGDPRDVLLSSNAMCQGQCINLDEGAKECWQCFITPPTRDPEMFSASVDLGEKRRPPLSFVLQTLTTSNGRRTAIATKMNEEKAQLSMLSIEDAERLMGFPPGYTEPAYPLRRPNERMPVYDVDLQTFRRFSLLGLACAVQQSRWLGERFADPYKVKFAFDALTEPFESSCPGPAATDRSSKAWPLAAYNMLVDKDEPQWHGRRRVAPDLVTEFPVIRAFEDLGSFCGNTIGVKTPRVELRDGYLRRLELNHKDVDASILEALDVSTNYREKPPETPPSRRAKASALDAFDGEKEASDSEEYFEQSTDEDESHDEDNHTKNVKKRKAGHETDDDDGLDEHGQTKHGRCVWVKWQIAKQKSMYWPAVALHPINNHTVVPKQALTELSAAEKRIKLNDDYRCVIFFGDRRFAWVKVNKIYQFARFYNEAIKQPMFRFKTKFVEAVDAAHAWSNARNLEKPLSPIVLRTTAHLMKDPTPCGACEFCMSKPQTRRSRGNTRSANNQAPEFHSACPQIKAVELARLGHIGATLTLRKHFAIGQRIMTFWNTDNKFFAGTLTSFNPLKFSFGIAYDDGDIDDDFKPWAETVCLAQDLPESEPEGPSTPAPSSLKRINARQVLADQMASYIGKPAEVSLDSKTMRRDARGVPITLQN